MVAKEHTGATEGRQRLIDMDVIESEEASGDDSIKNDSADLNGEDWSGLVGAGVT